MALARGWRVLRSLQRGHTELMELLFLRLSDSQLLKSRDYLIVDVKKAQIAAVSAIAAPRDE